MCSPSFYRVRINLSMCIIGGGRDKSSLLLLATTISYTPRQYPGTSRVREDAIIIEE